MQAVGRILGAVAVIALLAGSAWAQKGPAKYGEEDKLSNFFTGDHSRLAFEVQEELHRAKGRKLPMNQDGALGALGLDMGLDWRLLRALAFVPRSAGLSVHALEEMTRESGWRHVPDEEITYDGPARRPLGKR